MRMAVIEEILGWLLWPIAEVYFSIFSATKQPVMTDSKWHLAVINHEGQMLKPHSDRLQQRNHFLIAHLRK